jgi:hypothetical protein
MAKSRITYFVFIIVTIIVGLLSRHYAFIPAFIGDILWALMVYFIMRFIFVDKSYLFTIVASEGFCYVIEFSQLYKAPWIDELRLTLFGRLVLGSTFLWSDLLCYTAGIALGVLIDKQITRR